MCGRVIFICLFLQFCFSSATRFRKPNFYGSCRRDQYFCKNDNCISKNLYCDGTDNCGDNSDELYCNIKEGGPRHFSRFPCKKHYPTTFIPKVWRCDGSAECENERDETEACDTFDVPLFDGVELVNGSITARQKAVAWLQTQRQNISGSNKWGVNAPRIAVALYLADSNFFNGKNETGNELAYEIENQVLAATLKSAVQPMSMNKLALYIHALLVTCSNPRDVHGINLVAKLRKLVNAQHNYVSPITILALCNAQDEINASDIAIMQNGMEEMDLPYRNNHRATTLMTMECINHLPYKRPYLPNYSLITLPTITQILKRQQSVNGDFGNIYTTALSMQAIFATGTEDDGGWNMTKAVEFFVKSQKEDGSYENLLNTYLTLPVLFYNSLTNISSAHCAKNPTVDSTSVLENMNSKIGKKLFLKFTLWFGDEVDLAYSIEIRILENSTFFDVMKAAQAFDERYKFRYNLIEFRPYVYELAGFQNDPEAEKFWLLYKANATGFAETPVRSSPIDVIPKNKEEYVMWYRTGQWVRN